jgi:hypothetical protein
MNIPFLLTATQFASRLMQVRRSTWVALGVGVLVFIGLLIWAAIALLGWLWGQSQTWMEKTPAVAHEALAQIERVVPGAGETLGQLAPSHVPASEPVKKPPAQTQRDVSGTDLAPVARYPGLARTDWQRWGKQVIIEYEGKADYATVLDHYLKGFAERGFVQVVQSASATAETHEFTQGLERIGLAIMQKPNDNVSVKLNVTLP